MLAPAIAQLRATLGDPTAPIAVLTPASINGAFARQQLSLEGPWIRVEFWTPRQLVESLAEPLGLTVEPAGWRAATVGAMLRRAPEDQGLGRHSQTLAQPGWSAEVVQTLDRLENAGVGAQELLGAAAETPAEAERLELLARLLDGLAERRQAEGLVSFAELCAAILQRPECDTPAGRLKGAVILGDSTLAPCLHQVLKRWLAQRPHAVVEQAPMHRLEAAELGLRAAARPSAPLLADTRGAETLPMRVFCEDGGPMTGVHPVTFVACPDAQHEAREAVRAVQDAVLEGTPLDQIALVIADTSQTGEVIEALEQTGLPYVSMVGPTLAQTQAAGFLRLLVGMVAGRDRVVDWYELLRLPGLRLRVNLGPAAVAGRGRWRRILSQIRVNRDSDQILAAVSHWQGEQEDEANQAAAASLHQSVSTLLSEARALPERATLSDQAGAMAALVERWCFPGRDTNQLRAALRALGQGGPELTRSHALDAVMEQLEGSLVQTEDSLNDAAIRVLTPMSMLGARFERIVGVGFAQGIFPRKGQDSALLPPKLCTLLRERGLVRLVDEPPRHLERRRFAAMLSAMDGTLWVSRPMREQVQDRPQAPSSFLLDLLTALGGARAGYKQLRAQESALGSRSQGVMVGPERTLDPLEFRLAQLNTDPAGGLQALVSHPTARRLLSLHRAQDLWDVEQAVPGPWTGAVPSELALLPALSGEPLSAWALAQLLLTPAQAFFSQVLGARRPPRLRESWSPWDWNMDSALRQSLEASAAAGEPWLPRWEQALAEEGRFRPEFDADMQAHLLEIHVRRLAGLTVRGDEATLAQPQRIFEGLPWTLEGSVGLVDAGVLSHLAYKVGSKTRFGSDAMREVLQALALQAAGQPIESVQQQDLSGKSLSMPLAALSESAQVLAAFAAQRASQGWWPFVADSPYRLSGDPAVDPDPGGQAPILQRLNGGAQ